VLKRSAHSEVFLQLLEVVVVVACSDEAIKQQCWSDY